jgi:intein/homing endonuclease
MGTWFLNKTTGFDPSVERGALRKIAKDYMKKFSEGLEAYGKGNNRPLKETLKSFKRKVHNSIDDIINIRGGKILGNSLTEGFEEITEEAAQDAIKGMVDFASYMGWTGKEGSFGGWDNVFSKQGLSRYIETFVGGALGGAVFQGADALDKKVRGIPPETEKDIYKAILLGQGKELKEELKKVKKFFPSDLSTDIKEVNGKKYFAPTTDVSQSQSEIIYNKAL